MTNELTPKELDSIKLQIRGDGKMIRAHLKMAGCPAIFVASVSVQLCENHPHLFVAWKEWCKVAMQFMLQEVCAEAGVHIADTVEKPPIYDQPAEGNAQ